MTTNLLSGTHRRVLGPGNSRRKLGGVRRDWSRRDQPHPATCAADRIRSDSRRTPCSSDRISQSSLVRLRRMRHTRDTHPRASLLRQLFWPKESRSLTRADQRCLENRRRQRAEVGCKRHSRITVCRKPVLIRLLYPQYPRPRVLDPTFWLRGIGAGRSGNALTDHEQRFHLDEASAGLGPHRNRS